jgi:hypothetical protein
MVQVKRLALDSKASLGFLSRVKSLKPEFYLNSIPPQSSVHTSQKSLRLHYKHQSGNNNFHSKNYTVPGVQGGKVNIPGGHSIGHSKRENLNEYVSYSEPLTR